LLAVILLLALGGLVINRGTDRRRASPAQARPAPEAEESAISDGGLSGKRALELLPVTVEDMPDENSTKRFILHIPIKAQTKDFIDVKGIVIHVLFYDIVDGKQVLQTRAEVKSRWVTPPADWINVDTEELDVEYQLSKPEAEEATAPEDRKYYGYIVRVYYHDMLQGAVAEPERLREQYPPPATLRKESAANEPGGGAPHDTTAAPGRAKSAAPTETPGRGGGAVRDAADFASYARKLRERAILHLEPEVIVPTMSRLLGIPGRYPWKTGIVTTMFAVGYAKAGEAPHKGSVWDPDWETSYGGMDDPDPAARRKFIPVDFIPRQNPFYIALPYNDVDGGATKPEAKVIIPWFKEITAKGGWKEGQSVCRDRWLAIRSAAGKVCYAQWSDCGPFVTDHWEYVFGNEKPRPNEDGGAGLQVSPAVRDYLELGNTDVTDWKFVEASEVPNGPWAIHGENKTLTPQAGHEPVIFAITH